MRDHPLPVAQQVEADHRRHHGERQHIEDRESGAGHAGQRGGDEGQHVAGLAADQVAQLVVHHVGAEILLQVGDAPRSPSAAATARTAGCGRAAGRSAAGSAGRAAGRTAARRRAAPGSSAAPPARGRGRAGSAAWSAGRAHRRCRRRQRTAPAPRRTAASASHATTSSPTTSATRWPRVAWPGSGGVSANQRPRFAAAGGRRESIIGPADRDPDIGRAGAQGGGGDQPDQRHQHGRRGQAEAGQQQRQRRPARSATPC